MWIQAGLSGVSSQHLALRKLMQLLVGNEIGHYLEEAGLMTRTKILKGPGMSKSTWILWRHQFLFKMNMNRAHLWASGRRIDYLQCRAALHGQSHGRRTPSSSRFLVIHSHGQRILILRIARPQWECSRCCNPRSQAKTGTGFSSGARMRRAISSLRPKGWLIPLPLPVRARPLGNHNGGADSLAARHQNPGGTTPRTPRMDLVTSTEVSLVFY